VCIDYLTIFQVQNLTAALDTATAARRHKGRQGAALSLCPLIYLGKKSRKNIFRGERFLHISERTKALLLSSEHLVCRFGFLSEIRVEIGPGSKILIPVAPWLSMLYILIPWVGSDFLKHPCQVDDEIPFFQY
jgi:hypothetical protein